ncbi:MAG: alpha/beta fold hydrolase [Chitinispirillaceae bacterium]|nr:alpha/beta fold hydrolase [Chitinispirillaceae bacterium]
MVKRWIVFGGWGVGPDILRPLFGEKAILIDVADLSPLLVRDGALLPGWQEAVARNIKAQLPVAPFGVAGWSTGAMLAWAAAKTIDAACAVYLSATPSFCRRPGFPCGQRASVLRAMREKITMDPMAVLKPFYKECGIESGCVSRTVSAIPVPALTAGLHFLEHASLLPMGKTPCSTLFLHGNRDSIVPAAAGRYFSEHAGGAFEESDGPHAFFVHHHDEVKRRIDRFSRDIDL